MEICDLFASIFVVEIKSFVIQAKVLVLWLNTINRNIQAFKKNYKAVWKSPAVNSLNQVSFFAL